MWRFMRLCGVAMLTLGLGACETLNQDPYERPGTWRANDANDHNLRAMLVNPSDFYAGRGERGSSAIMANTAALRLYLDRLKQLPRVSTGTNVGGGDSGSAAGGGGPVTGLGASGGGAQ